MVDDASADAGATKEIAERHGAAFIGLAANVGPAAARNAGLAAVHSRARRVRRLRLRARRGVARAAARPLRRPAGGGRGAPHRPRRRHRAATKSSRSSLDRGARGRPGAAGEPHPLRAERGPGGPGRRGSWDPTSSILRSAAARTSTWSGGWARPAGTCATSRRAPSPTKARPRWRTSWSAAPSTGRRPAPLEPAPWGRRGAAAPLRLVAARLDPAAGAAGPCSRWLRCRRPSWSWPVGCAGSCATPSAWRHTSPGSGTTRSALPALASLTRAWSPVFVLGLVFRRTRRASALALVVPALHEWAADRQDLDPVRAVAVHVADDVAYGTGVWIGCARERTLVPLIPRVAWRARVWSKPALRERASATEPRAAADRDHWAAEQGDRLTASSPWRSGAARLDAPSPTPSRTPRRRRWTPRRWRAGAAPRARPGGPRPHAGAPARARWRRWSGPTASR